MDGCLRRRKRRHRPRLRTFATSPVRGDHRKLISGKWLAAVIGICTSGMAADDGHQISAFIFKYGHPTGKALDDRLSRLFTTGRSLLAWAIGPHVHLSTVDEEQDHRQGRLIVHCSGSPPRPPPFWGWLDLCSGGSWKMGPGIRKNLERGPSFSPTCSVTTILSPSRTKGALLSTKDAIYYVSMIFPWTFLYGQRSLESMRWTVPGWGPRSRIGHSVF